MQIFQWLLKVATHDDDDQARQLNNDNSIHTNRITTNGSNNKSRDITLYKNRGVINRRSSLRGSAGKDSDLGRRKNFKLFTLLCRKDVAKACFYSTLHLRRLRSVKRREFRNHSNSMKMKKEDMMIRGSSTNHKTDDSGTNVGNKVLPISDVTVSSSNNEQCAAGMTEKRDNIKIKGDNKTKTISRMKELLRWAAAAKSEKGAKFMGRKVLHFRNRGSLKSVQDDDQLSTESPKISFRWDVESCSTISSTYSGISMSSSLKNIDDPITSCNMLSLKSTPTHDNRRKGNWITTDSEFVVLEL